MDSFEFNKIAGALLGALLLTMGLGIVSDVLFYHPVPTKAGYPLPAATAKVASKPKKSVPLAVLLAKASPSRGKSDARACQACHHLSKGAGPKVGPPLYGVVGRKVASIAGFDYSAAMKKKAASNKGTWTFNQIFHFIRKPSSFVPGTKMGFGGEPDPQKRADIVAFLRTLSDHPLPLPKPPAAAPAKPAAPAKSATPAPGSAAPAPSGTAPAAANKPAAGAPKPPSSPPAPAAHKAEQTSPVTKGAGAGAAAPAPASPAQTAPAPAASAPPKGAPAQGTSVPSSSSTR